LWFLHLVEVADVHHTRVRAFGSWCPLVGVLEFALYPLVDVAGSVAEVFADPKPWWTFMSVAPGVDGGHRHTEVLGEFLDGEQSI
jgi:hypothetical protein